MSDYERGDRVRLTVEGEVIETFDHRAGGHDRVRIKADGVRYAIVAITDTVEEVDTDAE